MHNKHASKGLVVITVSTDEAKDKEARDKVRRFLNQNQATTINLLLDEPSDFIQEKLRYTAMPCYYVFDRQGKWTQFNSDDGSAINYRAMDQLILESLKEK